MLDEEELRRDLHTSYPSIWATLVHLYQADSTWFARLHGQRVASLSMFEPGSDLATLSLRWRQTLDSLVAFTSSRTEEQWEETMNYVTTRGDAFSQPLWQVLMHTVNHGTLHRGQILVMFRQIDRVPISVDLLNYYRSK